MGREQMSFEEDFLIAVAAVDDDKQKRSKKKAPQGSGCMVAVMTVILIGVFLGVVFIIL